MCKFSAIGQLKHDPFINFFPTALMHLYLKSIFPIEMNGNAMNSFQALEKEKTKYFLTYFSWRQIPLLCKLHCPVFLLSQRGDNLIVLTWVGRSWATISWKSWACINNFSDGVVILGSSTYLHYFSNQQDKGENKSLWRLLLFNYSGVIVRKYESVTLYKVARGFVATKEWFELQELSRKELSHWSSYHWISFLSNPATVFPNQHTGFGSITFIMG